MMKYLKTVSGINLVLLTGLCLAAHAQKLKSVQEKGVRPPLNIKIDGKLSEWDDTFQAYNPTVSLFYTIANDDKNLYLIIKSTDQMTSNKIAQAGLSFTINTSDKKKIDKDAYGVQYPLIGADAMASMRPQRGQGGPGGGFGGPGGGGFGGDRKPGQQPQMDSATLVKMHKTVIDAAKEIKLYGFKTVPDSVISIYNEYGLKAAVGYDPTNALTYEVSIPLKSLGLDITNIKEFSYNIKVNAMNFGRDDHDHGRDGGGPPGGGGQGGGGNGGGGGFGGGGGGRGGAGGGGGGQGGFGGGDGGGRPDGGGPPGGFQAMMASTDFWGKYTLVKAQ